MRRKQKGCNYFAAMSFEKQYYDSVSKWLETGLPPHPLSLQLMGISPSGGVRGCDHFSHVKLIELQRSEGYGQAHYDK